MELFIQTFSEYSPYTRHCCIDCWAVKMRDTMPRPQSCGSQASQQDHNYIVQHDSTVMYRKCVQEAVGVQKWGWPVKVMPPYFLSQNSPADQGGLDYMT